MSTAAGRATERGEAGWSSYTPAHDAPAQRTGVAPGRPAAAPFYRPELDLLRLVAFLGVFVEHTVPHLSRRGYEALGVPSWLGGAVVATVHAGRFGVDLFFALSSYLITTLLLREVERFGTLDVPAFYARRALRIWPLYFGFLLLCVFILPDLLPGEDFGRVHAVAFALFLGNWSTAFLGYPASAASVLWSVSVEEQFYLTWPLLVRWTGTRHLLRWCAGLLVLASVVRLWLVARGTPDHGMWANTFNRLDPIAAGDILALCYRGARIARSPLARVTAGVASLALFAAAGMLGATAGPLALLTYPAITLAAILAIVAVLRPDSRPMRTAGAWAPFVYLGTISYGLYVFHVLAFELVQRFPIGARLGTPLPPQLPALALTIGMAALSHRWVERPFLAHKARYTRVASRDTLPVT